MGAALIGAGAGLAEGILGLGAASAQRNWEASMANTQYQRGVADMRKAGLNPALMYGSGGPAPTPNVGMAQVGGAVSSALQGAQLQKQMDLLDAQTKSANSDAFKKTQEGLVSGLDLTDIGVKTGDEGGQALYTAYKRAMINNLNSAAQLNKLAAPAAGVTGSKAAGWLKMLGPVAATSAKFAAEGLF